MSRKLCCGRNYTLDYNVLYIARMFKFRAARRDVLMIGMRKHLYIQIKYFFLYITFYFENIQNITYYLFMVSENLISYWNQRFIISKHGSYTNYNLT